MKQNASRNGRRTSLCDRRDQRERREERDARVRHEGHEVREADVDLSIPTMRIPKGRSPRTSSMGGRPQDAILFKDAEPAGIRIREMPSDEQPREKLIRLGAGSLSNGELMAILLRTGTRKMNVLDLSRHLNVRFGGLREMIRSTWLELSAVPGMGPVKAVTLEAAFELARRIQISSIGDRPRISCPEDAAAYFAPFLRDLKREVFMVAFLNHSKYLTSGRRISEGGVSATVVDPAEVIRLAILHQASSFLIAHNHPSGSLQESHADVQLTNRITRAGRMLGIPLEDHIIIAGDGYMSFREKGFLE